MSRVNICMGKYYSKTNQKTSNCLEYYKDAISLFDKHQ